jgi:hypothetical protein
MMNRQRKSNRATYGGRCRVVAIFLACTLGLYAVAQAAGQTNPVPLINDPLVPSSAVPGGASFTLTVNGTGFVSGSVVYWNGSPRATNFANSSQVTATILSSDVTGATTASVTVTNPAPGGGSSNAAFFTVTVPKAAVPFAVTPVSLGGKGGGAIAFGDFNGDGKLDLALPDDVASFTILLGNGDGTFQPAIHARLTRAPAMVVAADFNHDGKLDLAMSEINNLGQIEALLGIGDGTFQPAQVFSTGQGQGSAIVAADLNADGKLDLIIANQNKGNVSVLLGNGDGTFLGAINIPTGASPVYVATGDFNHDGNLDLAVTNNGAQSVSILLGNGDGTFTSGTALQTEEAPIFVGTGDFNGDGNLDLAVTAGPVTSGSIQVFLGNGDGTFQTGVKAASGPFFGQVTIADVNGDGKADLASAIPCCSLQGKEGGLAVALGNGDGSFQSATYRALVGDPSFVALADLNDDGSMDVVASGPGSKGTLSILLQTPAIFSPGDLSFGTLTVGSGSLPQTTTMTNVGVGPLLITGVSVKGPNAGDFSQTNNCPSSLPQGASCTINVTFAPTADGVRNATINVADAGAPRLQGVTLKGAGTFAGLSPTNVSFGNQAVGTSSNPQKVTLTNLGSVALSAIKFTITGVNQADFSGTSTCGKTLAPGANCSISVVFTPHGTGGRKGTLTVRVSGTNNPAPIPLSGMGT